MVSVRGVEVGASPLTHHKRGIFSSFAVGERGEEVLEDRLSPLDFNNGNFSQRWDGNEFF